MNRLASIPAGSDDLERLAHFVAAHPRLFVLTGAGISTAAGIPDYRDREGQWKRRQPIQYQEFVRSAAVRRRYWARSLVGWRWFSQAQPSAAHHALAELERRGYVHQLVTQNVDGLHQRAGSASAIDLHGRLDTIVCLACGATSARDEFQTVLQALNPDFAARVAATAPDGDADLDGLDFGTVRVPDCTHCGGLLKPHVVFFGEAVPKSRVETALAQLATADALLVVGSSLMVFSGFRFARTAHAAGQPIAAVNLGRTRADELIGFKVTGDCDSTLDALCARLT